MTKIKICGLRREEDIIWVNQYLPDAAGFVFAPGKRQVTARQAADLAAKLNPSIAVAGVFVNEQPEQILRLLELVPLKIIQLHGDEPPEQAELLKRRSGCEIWKAFRIQNQSSIEQMKGYPADRYLLDAYHPRQRGGTGEVFDWDLLAEWKMERHILAGGLREENIRQAISAVHPYLVDISSGVESGGFKDGEKIRRVIQAVRRAEDQ